MDNREHITYKQLLEIVSWGIFNRTVKKNCCDVSDLKPIEGAAHGGRYIGSPGKDIFLMLPYLSDEQMIKVAVKLRKKFPREPLKSYVNISAFVRFIYGQFDKQGILRSDADFERMKKENIDWSLPRKFLKIFYDELEKNRNYFGLSMLCELEGHRLGDEAVINQDAYKLLEMEKSYLKTIKYAQKCKSYKHLFSIYYWASQYFMKFGDVSKTVKFSKLAVENAGQYYHKYFPQGERYYSKRLSQSLQYIVEQQPKYKSEFRKKHLINIRNDTLRKAFKKYTK